MAATWAVQSRVTILVPQGLSFGTWTKKSVPKCKNPRRNLTVICCEASSKDNNSDGDGISTDVPPQPDANSNPSRISVKAKKRTAESTDLIASSLTRRFGLGAGLAWVGFLAFGVISEQIKTRTEVYLQEQGTRDVKGELKEVVLPDNVKYVDLRIGGGVTPQPGDIIVLNVVGHVIDQSQTPFVDTSNGGRPIAFVFKRRPYVGVMCQGLEETLETMRVGGKRKVIVPPKLVLVILLKILVMVLLSP